MKIYKTLLALLITALLASAGCDDLINGMDSYEWMNAEDTARGMGDFVAMNLNSANGSLVVGFPGTAVTISTGVNAGCMSLDGQTSIPYDGVSAWSAAIGISFNDCQTNDSVFNGSIDIVLSGLSGSVGRFDFKGLVDVSGPVDGKLDIDLTYEVDLDCLTGWACWEGNVNGHSVEELWSAYSN